MTTPEPKPPVAVTAKKLALIAVYLGIAALVYFYAPAGFWYLVLLGTFLWNVFILIRAGIARFRRRG